MGSDDAFLFDREQRERLEFKRDLASLQLQRAHAEVAHLQAKLFAVESLLTEAKQYKEERDEAYALLLEVVENLSCDICGDGWYDRRKSELGDRIFSFLEQKEKPPGHGAEGA